EMVMSRREFWVERYGALEGSNRFFSPVQHDEQKPDLVLNAGGLGIKCGGLLPGGERAGGVAPRFQFQGAGFDLLQRFLSVNRQRDWNQRENETTEQTEITEQTEDVLGFFRLFSSFRLFRHLSSPDLA